jgi:hypothetical protein
MNQQDLLKILELVKLGAFSPEKAAERLKHLPFEDLGFAKVDHHRALRQGFSEVVFGKGKTPAQVADIVRAMSRQKDSRQNILVTRADSKIFAAVKRVHRGAKFHASSGVITIERSQEITGKGTILVVSAGTSDIPVAEEALLTAQMMGNRVEHPQASGASRKIDAGAGDDLRRRNGRRATKRCGRIGRGAGYCSANECWVRRELRRSRGPARHAQFLRLKRERREHR